MNIKLLKISSIADDNAAVWVATNLKDTALVCGVLGTTDTVWSRNHLRPLHKLATNGSGVNMHDDGRVIMISGLENLNSGEVTKQDRLKQEREALRLFMKAYVKWEARKEGGEDDLHYAYRVAKDLTNRPR
jgi:hypothetical protein